MPGALLCPPVEPQDCAHHSGRRWSQQPCPCPALHLAPGPHLLLPTHIASLCCCCRVASASYWFLPSGGGQKPGPVQPWCINTLWPLSRAGVGHALAPGVCASAQEDLQAQVAVGVSGCARAAAAWGKGSTLCMNNAAGLSSAQATTLAPTETCLALWSCKPLQELKTRLFITALAGKKHWPWS